MKTWQCDKDNDCDDAFGDEESSDEKNCSMYFVAFSKKNLHNCRVLVCHIIFLCGKTS
jgi:hypothetical protein